MSVSRVTAVLLIMQLWMGARADTRERVIAEYRGGHVTDLDLAASAFLDRRGDEFDTTGAVSLHSEDAVLHMRELRAIALNRILADQATSCRCVLSSEEKQALALNEELLYDKIYYVQRIQPLVAEARRNWRISLENVWRQHASELRIPAQYWFRFIAIGDKNGMPENLTTYTLAAERAYAELQSGDDFVKVARKYCCSLPVTDRGTIIGPVLETAVPPERLRILDRLRPGESSRPFHSNRGLMIVRLEKHQPATVPTVEESSSTLIQRGYIARFMPEEIARKHDETLVEQHPITVYKARFSQDKNLSDTVIASLPTLDITNADLFTPQFCATASSHDDKETLSQLRTIALRKLRAALGRKSLLSDVQRRAEKLLYEGHVGRAVLRCLVSKHKVAELADMARNPEASTEAYLRSMDFRLPAVR